MRVFVLYDKSGIHSGRALGSTLISQLKGRVDVQKGRPQRLAELLRAGQRFDYVINVGWFRDIQVAGAKVLNTPASISLSSNKRKARIHMQKDSLSSPQLWLDHKAIKEVNLPIIARETFHAKGTGLWYCRSLAEVSKAAASGATHFLKFIPNTREFRVHIMTSGLQENGEPKDDYVAIKLSEKVPHPNKKPTSDIVKNHESGWFFAYPRQREDKVLKLVRELAKKAVKSFGLHWGAVDIMVSKDTGEAYILEINSTPCLTDEMANTLEKYAEGVVVLLGLKPRPAKEVKPVEPVPVGPVKTEPVPANKKQALRSLLSRATYIG